jgi:hypothetical protein
MPKDFLPRVFQADLDRFYVRIILPTLSGIPLHDDVRTGEFTSMEEFLDNAEKHTNNVVVYEVRRSFALALAAIFQRQLQMWALKHFAEDERAKVIKMTFDALLRTVACKKKVYLTYAFVAKDIDELHLLANAVRHGDGPSLDKLRRDAPHLLSGSAEVATSHLSDIIRISDNHFVNYIRALMRFWGLADGEWGAVIDPPY